MRLVLCDDNRILSEALKSLLQARGHPVVGIAATAGDSVTAVVATRPDACLLGLRFPDGSGLDVARAIRRRVPETKIVVFSCVTDAAVVSETRRIGVAGFLRKDQDPETITRALQLISAGKTAFDLGSPREPRRRHAVPSSTEELLGTLTPRERQVLQRIVAGQSTVQMAREMKVAMTTVRSHIGHILNKLGAHSQVQAAAIARAAAASREPAGDGRETQPRPPGRVTAGR